MSGRGEGSFRCSTVVLRCLSPFKNPRITKTYRVGAWPFFFKPRSSHPPPKQPCASVTPATLHRTTEAPRRKRARRRLSWCAAGGCVSPRNVKGRLVLDESPVSGSSVGVSQQRPFDRLYRRFKGTGRGKQVPGLRWRQIPHHEREPGGPIRRL